jgi:hypothetical protein
MAYNPTTVEEIVALIQFHAGKLNPTALIANQGHAQRVSNLSNTLVGLLEENKNRAA